MHKKHRIFFSLGLILLFILFLLFLLYNQKYNSFFPKPPFVSYKIAASDSTSFPNTLFYDFESINDDKIVCEKSAFSGRSSICVNGKRNYSPVVQISFKQNKLLNSQEANYGAWICSPEADNPIVGKLVFQIVDRSNNLKYSSAIEIDIPKSGAKNWFYVSGKAEWKNCIISPDDFAKVYYWSNSKGTVYIDDLSVVFGKQEHKGSKPMTILTSDKVFTPVRNQPPYPFVYFNKEFLGNTRNGMIIRPDGKDSLKMNNDDEFVSGRFVKGSNDNDQLLVVRNSKPFALVWYDQLEHQLKFQRCLGENDKRLSSKFPFTAADVDGDGMDELITCTPLSVINIFKFQSQAQSFRLIFSGTPEGMRQDVSFQQLTAISKKNTKEKCLLAEDKMGKIMLIKYSDKKLKAFSLGKYENVSNDRYTSKIICGSFLKNIKNESLLFLYSENKTGKCFYKMFEIDQEENVLHRLFDGNFDNKCDTLDPKNTYFVCDLNDDGIQELISFSNGWRYDSKIIRFDKDGYTINENVDFSGYAKDQNPKYYENFKMVAGNFLEKNRISLFCFYSTTEKVHRAYNFMPQDIGIYSYPEKHTEQ